MSRAAVIALACLLLAVAAASLRPSADAGRVALVFRPGTPPDAMLATAVRLGLLPVTQPAGRPVLVVATGERGWQAAGWSGPLLAAIAVDGPAGCGLSPVTTTDRPAPTEPSEEQPRNA